MTPSDSLPDAASAWRDAAGTLHAPAAGEVRIVSLVPSLTELVCELGLADRLVGRTGFCIHPRETLRAIPKVGGTKDVRMDALRELAPTHVIVNIDENRRETFDELSACVPNIIVTHPCRPEDNFALYRLFGGVFGCADRAARLGDELAAALAHAAALAATLPPERVLYLIWRAPWMTIARDTYISATLRAVGWETVPEDAAQRYPEVDWAAIGRSDVARVLLSTEPYRFRERHLAEVERLAGKPATLIDGEMTSWYGSRAAPGLRYLTGLRTRLVQEGVSRADIPSGTAR